MLSFGFKQYRGMLADVVEMTPEVRHLNLCVWMSEGNAQFL